MTRDRFPGSGFPGAGIPGGGAGGAGGDGSLPRRATEERFLDHVDGSLTPREQQRFAAECRVNPQLQRDLEQYERTVAWTQAALREPAADQALTQRILAAVAAQPVRTAVARAPVAAGLPRSLRAWVASLAAAMVLLAVAIGLDAWQLPQPGSASSTEMAWLPPSAPQGSEPQGSEPQGSEPQGSEPQGMPAVQGPVTQQPDLQQAARPDAAAVFSLVQMEEVPETGNAGKGATGMGIFEAELPRPPAVPPVVAPGEIVVADVPGSEKAAARPSAAKDSPEASAPSDDYAPGSIPSARKSRGAPSTAPIAGEAPVAGEAAAPATGALGDAAPRPAGPGTPGRAGNQEGAMAPAGAQPAPQEAQPGDPAAARRRGGARLGRAAVPPPAAAAGLPDEPAAAPTVVLPSLLLTVDASLLASARQLDAKAASPAAAIESLRPLFRELAAPSGAAPAPEPVANDQAARGEEAARSVAKPAGSAPAATASAALPLLDLGLPVPLQALAASSLPPPAEATAKPGDAERTEVPPDRFWLLAGSREEVAAAVRQLAIWSRDAAVAVQRGEVVVLTAALPAALAASVPAAAGEQPASASPDPQVRLILRCRLAR